MFKMIQELTVSYNETYLYCTIQTLGSLVFNQMSKNVCPHESVYIDVLGQLAS